jgi:hypothetical protein
VPTFRVIYVQFAFRVIPQRVINGRICQLQEAQ